MTSYRPPPLSNSPTLEQSRFSSAPISNALASRFSTRLVVITGSLLAMAGYVLSSLAQSSWVFFFTYGICIGAYTCVLVSCFAQFAMFLPCNFTLTRFTHRSMRAILFLLQCRFIERSSGVELRTLD